MSIASNIRWFQFLDGPPKSKDCFVQSFLQFFALDVTEMRSSFLVDIWAGLQTLQQFFGIGSNRN